MFAKTLVCLKEVREWATLALLILAACLSFKSWKLSQDTFASFAKQLTMEHPPRLEVMNVWMAELGSPRTKPFTFAFGKTLVGNVPLVNVGRDRAIIGQYYCAVRWVRGPLPMYRDFLEKPESCGVRGLNAIGKIKSTNEMMPGDATDWSFKTVVPKDYRRRRLYILGGVIFADRVSKRRFYVFARRYDPKLHRFIAEDASDYESQDVDWGKR